MLETLGRTLGFSFAAGINLYATVAILGLVSRFRWIEGLPEQFTIFDNDWIIATALVLYVVEFIADKIPWFDSLWDAVHTAVRPIGGALIAVASLGHASPALQGAAALAGAFMASSSHFAKSGTRVAANTSPEPFSNWMLSLAEDSFVVALGLLAIKFPVAAAIVVLASVALIAWFARWVFRAVRRRFTRAAPSPSDSGPRRSTA